MAKRRKKPDPLIGWQEPEDRPEGRFLTEYDIADGISMVRPMEPIEVLDKIVAIVFREMGDALARGDKIDLRDRRHRQEGRMLGSAARYVNRP